MALVRNEKTSRELVSDGNKDPNENWNKGHPYYTVEENLAALCTYPRAVRKT